MDEKILRLKEIIYGSEKIVFFGGAGVSTESNIPDFRSVDGLYNLKYKYSPEIILSHTFYRDHTDEFYTFYKDKMIFPDAKPNIAHKALVKLEEMGRLTAVITQNIDNLHQAAGSKNVFELHGSIYRNYCEKCGKFYDLKYVASSEGVPTCECGGTIKPDVVLYEEGLDYHLLSKAIKTIMEADALIIGGTSLAVYPAAGLIDYYKGDKLVLINKEQTAQDGRANLVIHDSIGNVLSQVVDVKED